MPTTVRYEDCQIRRPCDHNKGANGWGERMFAYQMVAAHWRRRELVQIAEAIERDEQIMAIYKFDTGVPRLHKKCNNAVMHLRFPELAKYEI